MLDKVGGERTAPAFVIVAGAARCLALIIHIVQESTDECLIKLIDIFNGNRQGCIVFPQYINSRLVHFSSLIPR